MCAGAGHIQAVNDFRKGLNQISFPPEAAGVMQKHGAKRTQVVLCHHTSFPLTCVCVRCACVCVHVYVCMSVETRGNVGSLQQSLSISSPRQSLSTESRVY